MLHHITSLLHHTLEYTPLSDPSKVIEIDSSEVTDKPHIVR